MFARLPDKAIVQVLQTTHTNWLKIASEDLAGWIVKKYVDTVVDVSPGSGPAVPEGDQEMQIWQSADSCASSVNAGARLARNPDETIRLVTWNIRWFPQGTMYGNNQDKYTDQAWLSCALAWLDADIIAVQEILDHTTARQAMENVLDGLQGYNGGNWEIDLQQCGSGNAQHVGFIYNADRVELAGNKDMWQFNGKASGSQDSPCKGNLRPGRYAYVKSKSTNGFDFHLIVVHTDSAVEQRDLNNRNRVLDRLDDVSAALLSTDRDIVIIGDYNTMGTGTITASTELSAFSAKVGNETPGFTDVPVEPRCTEYYRGNLTAGQRRRLMHEKSRTRPKSSVATICRSLAIERKLVYIANKDNLM
jgi:endonuclease/exonuclease/phosphatase family metal-dependent hydrolase